MMSDVKQHSPYRYGADQGFFFGIYLSAMFLCSVLGVRYPVLNLLFVGLFAAVPFLLYRWLRRAYVEVRGTLTLSALWLQGIVIFMCGMMIAAVVSLLYFRFIEPGFIIGRLYDIMEIYESSPVPELQEMAVILGRMIEQKAVPSVGSIVMEMVWLGVFTGSILSLIIGLIVRARKIVTVK